MRSGGKGKAAGAPVNDPRGIDRLQELAFILQGQPFGGDLIVRESAHLRMLSQHPEQQGSAAAMQPTTKDEIVRLRDLTCLLQTERAGRACSHSRFSVSPCILHKVAHLAEPKRFPKA